MCIFGFGTRQLLSSACKAGLSGGHGGDVIWAVIDGKLWARTLTDKSCNFLIYYKIYFTIVA